MPSKTIQEQLAEQWQRRGETALSAPQKRPDTRCPPADRSDLEIEGEHSSLQDEPKIRSGLVSDAVSPVIELENILEGVFDASSLDTAVDQVIDGAIPLDWSCEKISLVETHLKRWRQSVIEAPESADRQLRRMLLFSRNDFAASILIDVVAECDALLVDGSSKKVHIERFAKILAPKPKYQDALWGHKIRHRKREDERDRESYIPIQNLADQFFCVSHQITFDSPKLSMDDDELCHAWANLGFRESMSEEYGLIEHIGSYQALRLYSARQAEHVAACYYRSVGKDVLDTSLYQITKIGDEWKTHDLEVDGAPVDVKNSRRSFSSPGSYSEHCVANWKHVSRRGAGVSLAGVLSDYVKENNFVAGDFGSAVFLGEVSIGALKAASTWFENYTAGKLVFVDLDRPVYFPGWVFDYPDEHYANSLAEESVDDAIESALSKGLPATKVPRWLLAHGSDVFSENQGLTGYQKELLRSIWSIRKGIGFSRMSATMFVLSTFVRSLLESDLGSFDEDQIRTLMFPVDAHRKTDGCRPLGRLDPEGFVSTMLSALGTANRLARQRLEQFRGFQLVRANILRGVDEAGSRTTILAYCGGFRAKPPRVRCGNWPLVIGESEVCPFCRYLVCQSCGWCSENCEQLTLNALRSVELQNE